MVARQPDVNSAATQRLQQTLIDAFDRIDEYAFYNNYSAVHPSDRAIRILSDVLAKVDLSVDGRAVTQHLTPLSAKWLTSAFEQVDTESIMNCVRAHRIEHLSRLTIECMERTHLIQYHNL